MSKETTDFFNSHSLNFLEMALRHDHSERMANPDGYGRRRGDCGDEVEFFLLGDSKKLETVSFFIQGCVHTTACSNTIACFAEGRSTEQAWQITPEKIADFLQTLPDDHFHCAELAAGAFYRALKDLS